MPYPDVYEFLSCHGSNPCWGWLNSNETWRNITSAHAASLNAVYPTVGPLTACTAWMATTVTMCVTEPLGGARVFVCLNLRQIVANHKYNNFVVDYHYPDWVEYINNYVVGGGTAEDLIEYVLGRGGVRVRVLIAARCTLFEAAVCPCASAVV